MLRTDCGRLYQPDLFPLATLTSAASQTCAQVTSRDSRSAISSPASADGLRLCASPEYHLIPDSGQDPVHASHSVPQDDGREPQTSATCGRSSATSSRSASLQSSLESRLRVLTEGIGSPLYGLKWKHWDMQSGPPICALRASAHHTSDSDFGLSGWPTPIVNDSTGSQYCYGGTNPDGSRRKILKLPGAAKMAARPTPTANNGTGAGTTGREGGLNLQSAAALAQPARRKATGEMLTGSGAGMGSGGQLSPEHSRWLMGYPAGWHTCGDTETPSSRKSRRRLSKQP